ncbi:dTMP kinase [Brackiella oedipodis]|uniref:dTMP kinase n=1 Tax=Brackiella oedipodis TaxID=124225 RepID=UPI0005701429|nr:dTMP kinase [Brackiella oedipodis]
MKQGLFVTLEGVDGAGKSSHHLFLKNFFEQAGYVVIQTREPGGTPLGESLRQLLLHEPMYPETELLLMFAARQESVQALIKPALAQGKVVISDRFTDSSFAYQGGGRGFAQERIQTLADWVHADLQPDLTLLFDLDIDTARQRLTAAREADRFEQEQAEFFARVRASYLDLAKQHPERFIVIDSRQPIAQIQRRLQRQLIEFFSNKGIKLAIS